MTHTSMTVLEALRELIDLAKEVSKLEKGDELHFIRTKRKANILLKMIVTSQHRKEKGEDDPA